MVRFSPEHSHHHHHGPLDGLDARARILAAVGLSLGIAVTPGLWGLGLGLAVAVLLGWLAGLRLKKAALRIIGLDLFVLLAVITLPFTMAGPVAFEVFGWQASWPGLERAFGILVKATAIMVMIMGLIGGLEIPALGRALYRLHLPDGLVHLLLFTVRYASVLGEEFSRLKIAMKARNFRPGINIHSYRTLGFLVGMVFIRGLERSERILDAMKCRGFHGHFHVMEDLVWQNRDSIFLFSIGVVISFIFAFGAL